MEQELRFIQNQLWAVISLFLILIASNIVCYVLRKSEKNNDPQFDEMWNKGEIDKLIKESKKYLVKYPNHLGALYFGAKALLAKKENLPVAKSYLKKLQNIEPGINDEVEKILSEIENIERS